MKITKVFPEEIEYLLEKFDKNFFDTFYNPETGLYEYKVKAKTLAEFQNQRKAAIQKLGFYEDIIEANFDLPDTKIGGNHHKLKVVEEVED